MPGGTVKDWRLYHKLRRKGYTKTSAARTANFVAKRRRLARRKKRR